MFLTLKTLGGGEIKRGGGFGGGMAADVKGARGGERGEEAEPAEAN